MYDAVRMFTRFWRERSSTSWKLRFMMVSRRSLTRSSGPEIPTAILHPFEVRDGDAAGVGQNVGDDEDAVLIQYGVRCRGSGPVRALTDYARLDVARVLGRDHVFQRGGKKHVDVERQQLGAGDRVSLIVAFERSVLLHVGDGVIDVDSVRIVQRHGAIADRNDLAAFAGKQLRRD